MTVALFEFQIGWRYFGAWLSSDFQLGVYRAWYDGPHVCIHCGWLSFGWGAA